MTILDGDRSLGTTADDLLGFESGVESLCEIILKEELLAPTVVGVYGSWGSGKTWFMQMMRKYVEDRSPGTTLWINAWAYDRREAVWAGLILALLRLMRDTATVSQDVKKKQVDGRKEFCS